MVVTIFSPGGTGLCVPVILDRATDITLIVIHCMNTLLDAMATEPCATTKREGSSGPKQETSLQFKGEAI